MSGWCHHWTDRWLGIPYVPLGRGAEGYDCLGLFMAVQKVEFGLWLNYGLVEIGAAEGDAVARHIGEWRRVETARPGDAVLMRRGAGWHVGVALDDTRMLHAEAPASVIDTYRSSKWGRRLDGIYRFDHHG